MTTTTPVLLSQLLLITTVLGCASERSLPTPPSASEASLVARESVREVPIVPTSNTVSLAPGAIITIKTSDRTLYLCSNGALMVCDRHNMKLYCECPGSRRRR